VLDGIVVYAVTIGEQSGTQLLGPGDLLLLRSDDVPPPWLDNCAYRAVAPTRLALLGNEFLRMSRRVPEVVRALHESIGDQMQRLSGQLVICQLPRVEQRVLAMMWLLASEPESGSGSVKVATLELGDLPASPWHAPPTPDPSLAYSELRDTVPQLREEHLIGKQQVRDQLTRVKTSRAQMAMARERISEDALSRRRPPSS
jgi:hypothetical protein